MVQATHRGTVATVNLNAIKQNIHQVKKHIDPSKKFLAVVKANAYGHGAIPVAKAAKEAGVDGFCVAILDEALELRANGLEEDFILVMGLTDVRDASLLAKENIRTAVGSLEWVQRAVTMLKENPTASPLRIHVAVDTGMGRIGFRTEEELQELERYCEKEPLVELEGIFTHFATADGEDEAQVQRQYRRFQELVTSLTKRPEIVHLANSAMTLWHEEFETDAVRVGIAMYGYNPSDRTLRVPYALKPAFTLVTEISYVKQMKEGDTISYGARYKAYEDEWIATLPIGYADGLRRDLSSQSFLVDGKRCPIRGVICMDQCMISLPAYYPEGTTVTIFGTNKLQESNPSEMAASIGTIGYELLCGISNRVPREYIEK